MQPDDPGAPPETAYVEAPASPLKRLLALLALVALLASAGVSSCWILTGQASFIGRTSASRDAAAR